MVYVSHVYPFISISCTYPAIEAGAAAGATCEPRAAAPAGIVGSIGDLENAALCKEESLVPVL